MNALDLVRGSVFSIDGGENWLVAIAEPRDGSYETLLVKAVPRGNTSLAGIIEINLGWYDHVWEPDPVALNRGDEYLPIKI